ncbi:MAG: hypothetical protein ACR2QT_05860 [Woeseiaceae bacterium]
MMNGTDCVVLIVDSVAAELENLRELIEFMDTPNVCTAAPADWQETLGDRRLEAVFVGPDLSSNQVDSLLDGVAKLDPNVPIVILNGELSA